MDEIRLSVVIPYYNNDRTLAACLESFSRGQTRPPDEIVLVDDGSARPAAEVVQAMSLPVPVRLETCAHGGQSRASNVGVAAASGEVVLLTCADIVAVPEFVDVHVQAHRQARASGQSVAVMGHIAYAPWMQMTPFLRYLSTDGPQFCFGSIGDPERVDGALLYSPNFSVERSWMRRLGGFDEKLPYGFQDTDFGLRLVQAGIRLQYRRQAWAHHDHPNDLTNFCRRNRAVGRHFYRFARRYPFMFEPGALKATLELVACTPDMLSTLLPAVSKLESILLRSKRWDDAFQGRLFQLYQQALSAAFFEGVLLGDEDTAPWLGYSQAAWTAMRQRAPADTLRPLLEASAATLAS